MESVHQIIEKKILHRKKGDLIFPTEFKGIGPYSAIKMSLSRLVTQNKIKRLAHGIYYIPKIDSVFGELYPAPEKVAEQVAKKEKVRIKLTGSHALNKLGLSTQVPTRLVYLTDGERRIIKIGKTIIEFKPTTPKNLSFTGPLSSLVIQGLVTMGTENLGKEIEDKIIGFLKQENPSLLKKDMAIAPTRIHNYLFTLLYTKI